MANTLTAVLPNLYEAADMVARELVGFIPAAYMNASAERAAKDQTISYPIVGSMSAADITPAATSSTGTDQTVTAGSMTINKSRKVSFHWTGEQQQSLRNGDVPQGVDIRTKQFAQAMRTLVNEVEADLWAAAYKGASRAYGTAATAPFGTAGDLSDFAGVRRILDDNGAPQTDLHLVLGSAAMANLRGKQSVLFKVNEAGTAEFLRQGVIGEVMGLMIHNSYPVTTATKGTGTSYQSNNASGYAIGDTSIAVDTGSGTVLAGDVVTFAGDTNKYVVTTGIAAAGTLVLAAPGLRATLADNVAMTVGNTATQNVAFYRDALHLIARAPARPEMGDSADDVTIVQDSHSGLAFEVAVYKQYRQVSFEVGLAWGVEAVKPEFICNLLG